ncbi:MAG: hypothetical protein RLZZ598_737, partial [Pseudomonadota bacterium]
FLGWRRGQPALLGGDMSLLPPHGQVLAYVRSTPTERVLCAFNFSASPATLELPCGPAVELSASGLQGGRLDGDRLHLEPFGGLFARLD